MQATRRGLLAATAIGSFAPGARAQGRPKIRIGVLNDQSGTYRDTTGTTSIACVQQAVQDFGDRGFDIEELRADHQNTPDIGATLARQWIDRDGVDVIADVPTSSVALAVAEVCRQKDRIHLNASATAVALTGEQCSPNTIVWSFDTYMMAASTGGAAHSSPHFALASFGMNTPAFDTASAKFCISGASLCSGMLGMRS